MKKLKSLTTAAVILFIIAASFCTDSLPVSATETIPITTYDNFRNAVIGREFDVDGYPTDQPYQCFDGAAILWQQSVEHELMAQQLELDTK